MVADQIEEHQTHFATDARSNLLFGSYFTTIGQSDEGLAFLERALVSSPKKQQILFELGSAYVSRQDANNAIRVTKKAYELEPSCVEARKIYAIVSLMAGQTKLVADLIAPIKETPAYYNDDRFLNIYKQSGDEVALQEIISLREKNK